MATTTLKRVKKNASPVLALNRALADVESRILAYEELRMIRDRLGNGQLTAELYSFIDHHHGLESLFRGLPSGEGVTGAALEDLKVTQVQYVDQALEGMLQSIKDALVTLWNKFVDWLMDWIDTNRRMKFRLQRHKRKYGESMRNYGGDPSNYAKIKGRLYNYTTQWTPMYDAVVGLHTLLEKVPQNDPAKWYEDNFDALAKYLKEFGYQLNCSGSAYAGVLVESGMIHSKQEMTLGEGGAGWAQSNLGHVIDKAIALLENEEKSRGMFQSVRRAFDRLIGAGNDAQLRDIAAMKRLLRICKKTKDFAAVVARAVNDVCNLALNAA